MKKLFLLRHGDALPNSISMLDFSRRLSQLGHLQAKMVGRYLTELNIRIDKALISTALRTKETSEYILNIKKKVFTDEVYEASLWNYITLVSSEEDEVESLIIIGHNPTITSFANYLSTKQQYSMPTAGLVHFELDISNWSQIKDEPPILSENNIYLS
jgi:phosphohistidine phosphatase